MQMSPPAELAYCVQGAQGSTFAGSVEQAAGIHWCMKTVHTDC